MRPILFAAVALLFTIPMPAAAGADPATGPVSPRVSVTCWFGSDAFEILADRVVPEGGGLRIESMGTVQLTTVPCIARTLLAIDPHVTEPTGVACLDHSGAVIYKGEVLNVGSSEGVLWWYEKDYDSGYVLVLANTQCWIGDAVADPAPGDLDERAN